MMPTQEMISGLRSQRQKLTELIQSIQNKDKMNMSDRLLYDRVTQGIELNLKQLRKKMSAGHFRNASGYPNLRGK